MAEPKQPSDAQRLMQAGVGRSHAYMIVQGHRAPNLDLAVKIYDATGLRYGPLKNATPAEVRALCSLVKRQGEQAVA